MSKKNEFIGIDYGTKNGDCSSVAYNCVVCSKTEVCERNGVPIIDLRIPPGSLYMCRDCWNTVKLLIMNNKKESAV